MNEKAGIPHFEVPAELRAMTEKSIEQARVAFNTVHECGPAGGFPL
jgi:hypothetical protein